LRKGYSYDDLSSILAEQDILVSAATLKLYLASKRKKFSSRKKSNESNPVFITKSGSKTSTNVTSSEESFATGLNDSEVYTMESVETIKPVVSLNSTSRTKSSNFDPGQSEDKKSTLTRVKPKVLSGLDDDLKSDFNDF
jgi:hypothetical protein